MDKYVIDNMPEDDVPEAPHPTADIVLKSGDLLFSVHHDGTQYVLTCGGRVALSSGLIDMLDEAEQGVVLSVLIAFGDAQPIGMSSEASKALGIIGAHE